MTTGLRNQTILFVYGEIDRFVVELQQALDEAGADSVIARTPGDAINALARFEFDGAVINYLQEHAEYGELVHALAGLPTLVLCSPLTPLSALTRMPILSKPVAPGAVLTALARLLRSAADPQGG
ncbi:MAG TPA: hypothetical protein VFA64_17380 [Hyphomicrobiaceae bacterium]|nr:hypothetical protein [Hyphomicrobiaceae bacterium]